MQAYKLTETCKKGIFAMQSHLWIYVMHVLNVTVKWRSYMNFNLCLCALYKTKFYLK
jgi:hypothetical protein